VDAEGAAASDHAFDRDAAVVDLGDVLDFRETEAGPAQAAPPSLFDAVEALEEPRQVFAPSLISRSCPLMRRDTYRPITAARTAMTVALIAMLPQKDAREPLTHSSGTDVRVKVVRRPSSVARRVSPYLIA
jgi:D-alanyl-D-alanine dipeptidase